MKIPLTQNQFAIVDAEDYDFLMQWKWYADKNGRTFYVKRKRRKADAPGANTILMHRVIAERMGLEIEGQSIDHIKRNGLDNRRSNLRVVTHFENHQNKNLGKSGIRGVRKYYNKWRAEICFENKMVYLGSFKSKEDAIKARKIGENLFFHDQELLKELIPIISIFDTPKTWSEVIRRIMPHYNDTT